VLRDFGIRNAFWSGEGRTDMLRTMITDTPFEQKWVLQGRLSGQWADDLKEKWENMKSSRTGRKCVIDLEDVTSMDGRGEIILLEMVREGADIITSRFYVKHVVETLNDQLKAV
jgi:hypothetical protein